MRGSFFAPKHADRGGWAGRGRSAISVLVAVTALVLSRPLPVPATTRAISLILTPKAGPPTTAVRVSARGFDANASIRITFSSLHVADATTDSAGAFSATFHVPDSATPGSHPVRADELGSARTGVAQFIVRTDWSRFRFDAQGTGANTFENLLDLETAPKLVRRWSFTTGGPVYSSPAVARGIVYVGSDDGNLYAIDGAGRQRWKFATGGPIESSPAVEGGAVFIGSDDGRVYAINALTGSRMWAFTTGGPVRSSPDVVGGVVYVGSSDGSLYALRAGNGTKGWAFATRGPVLSSPSVGGGLVYVGSDDSKLYAVTEQGRLAWSFQTQGAVESSPALGLGAVIFGSAGYYYSLDAASGRLNWKHATGGHETSSPAISLSERAVFFGLHGWNVEGDTIADGVKRWSFTSRGPVVSSPAVADGVVYAGSDDRYFYALKSAWAKASEGGPGERFFPRVLYRYRTGGAVRSSPAVSDGMVFVGSNDGSVYAFGLPS